jgi:stress-induced-phosphoprotein 1
MPALAPPTRKKGDLTNAIANYQKSLTEHRTPEVVNKLRLAEKNKIEGARKAYIDPEKAEEARELGNQKFKESDWPGAVEAYTEMTKRAPEDPRGYSNRAAAFIKLLEFPSAIEDCDKAIKKDPKFIPSLSEKGASLFRHERIFEVSRYLYRSFGGRCHQGEREGD